MNSGKMENVDPNKPNAMGSDSVGGTSEIDTNRGEQTNLDSPSHTNNTSIETWKSQTAPSRLEVSGRKGNAYAIFNFQDLKILPVSFLVGFVGTIGSALKLGAIMGAGLLAVSPISLIIWSGIFVVSVAIILTTLVAAFEQTKKALALVDNMGGTISTLRDKNADLKEQLGDAEKKANELKASNEEANRKCDNLKVANDNLFKQVQAQGKSLEDASEIIKKFASDLDKHIEESRQVLQSSADSAQNVIERMKDAQDLLGQKIVTLQQNVVNASGEIDDLVRAQKEVLEKGMKSFDSEKEHDIAGAMNTLLNAVKEALEINTQIGAKNQDLSAKVADGLNNINIELKNEFSSLEYEISDIERKIEEKRKALEETKKKIQTGVFLSGEVKKANADLQAEIKRMGEEIKDLQDNLSKARKDHNQLGSILGNIQQTNSDMETEIEQARRTNGELGDILGNAAAAGSGNFLGAALGAFAATALSSTIGTGAIAVLGVKVGMYLSDCISGYLAKKA